MIVSSNLYNKALKRKLKQTGKSKNKNLLDCSLYCYWQNIRNSDRKFLLEANKIVMFRTYNFFVLST